MSARTRTIACPACQAQLLPREILDGGTVAVPEASAIEFRCPRCKGVSWAQLRSGHFAVGAPIDDPAVFRPVLSVPDASLSVRPDTGWVDCWYEGRYRRYPARLSSARGS